MFKDWILFCGVFFFFNQTKQHVALLTLKVKMRHHKHTSLNKVNVTLLL